MLQIAEEKYGPLFDAHGLSGEKRPGTLFTLSKPILHRVGFFVGWCYCVEKEKFVHWRVPVLAVKRPKRVAV